MNYKSILEDLGKKSIPVIISGLATALVYIAENIEEYIDKE